MLLKSAVGVRSDELESALAVGSDGNASADFPKRMRGFIDLDMKMFMLEKTEC